MPAKQFKAVKGGETMTYPGVTVETALGHHNTIAQHVPAGHLEKQAAALAAMSLRPPLDRRGEEAARDDPDARQPRSEDRREGVINYMFTFGNGFHVLFADSPGPVTDGQRALIAEGAGRGRRDAAVRRLRRRHPAARGPREGVQAVGRLSSGITTVPAWRCGPRTILPRSRFATRARRRGQWKCSTARRYASTRRRRK